MSTIKKHIGKIRSTDQRCVVVFMSLPDKPESALIINVESLSERYEQLLMEVVNSPEGQQGNDLASTMTRRIVPETGRTVLEEFHNRGFMRAESVDNILMMPKPNQPFPLRDILTQMGVIKNGTTAEEADNGEVKYNHLTANQNATVSEERMAMANNMLMEAEMLQAEANKKKEQAYSYAPHLRPQTPTPIVETKRGPGRPTKAELAARAAEGGSQDASGE